MLSTTLTACAKLKNAGNIVHMTYLTIDRPRLRLQAGGEAVESIVVYDVVAACGCGAAAVPGVVGAGAIAVGEADPVARRA